MDKAKSQTSFIDVFKKLFILTIVFFSLSRNANGQGNEAFLKDAASPKTIVDAAFASLSGTPDEERDWDRFRNLFAPTAQFIVAPTDAETGKNNLIVRNIEEVIESQGSWLKENPLFEYSIHEITEQYRHLAHVLCTYESRKSEEEMYGRGISSFQLMHDGDRWWIVNWFWLGENSDNPIPNKYLNE